MAPMRFGLVATLLLALPASAVASDIAVREFRSDDTLLTMARYRFDNGRLLNLSVGIGSGAFRHPDDPPNVMWTVGDRGPNLTCGDFKSVAQMELPACRETKNARIFLTPSYAPSIYRVILTDAGAFRITDVITLKDRDGTPLNGMPNPLRNAVTEPPLDGHGKPLDQNVHGIDAEAVIRLTDGTFWVSDENAPSIIHVSSDGRIITRHVPQGMEEDFADARYGVVGSLPAILGRRQLNRGIEAIAVSRDERFLFFMLQSPLANPDIACVIVGLAELSHLDEALDAVDLEPLPKDALARSWESLRSVGNLSSASVLYVLSDLLEAKVAKPGDIGVMMAMGPGFCAELVLLKW